MIILNKKLILNKILELAEICNQILLKNFKKINLQNIFYKDDYDEICTSIDFEINDLCKEFLQKNFYYANFISEEDPDIINIQKDLHSILKNDLVFIIDPIDGTSNFVNGFELFCFSLGIVSRSEFIGGVVIMPLLNKTIYGIKNIGAFIKNHITNEIFDLKIENFDNLIKNQKKYVLSCSSRIQNNILNKTMSFRVLGSIAISIAYCANLIFDGFFGKRCKIWDFAGGVGILNSMNFPIYIKKTHNSEYFNVAAHYDKNELNKLINLF
jgi:myo-inositol-1(or 4)-monophosphatase